MGENCGGIRQESPIRRVRSRGPDESSPTGYWSNRYEVRCGALPTDGLVDRVLRLGLDSLVKEHRLELLFPLRGASAGRDSWRGTGLADVIKDTLDRMRFRHEANDTHVLAAAGDVCRILSHLIEWSVTVNQISVTGSDTIKILTFAIKLGNFNIAMEWCIGSLISIFRKRPAATYHSAWKQ